MCERDMCLFATAGTLMIANTWISTFKLKIHTAYFASSCFQHWQQDESQVTGGTGNQATICKIVVKCQSVPMQDPSTKVMQVNLHRHLAAQSCL